MGWGSISVALGCECRGVCVWCVHVLMLHGVCVFVCVSVWCLSIWLWEWLSGGYGAGVGSLLGM